VLNIQPDEPLAVAAVEAIHSGNIELLKRLLHENPPGDREDRRYTHAAAYRD
jgi:hypothetical protein